eukprot:scaffold721_cov88-Isochrysis_galbana.AAC.2
MAWNSSCPFAVQMGVIYTVKGLAFSSCSSRKTTPSHQRPSPSASSALATPSLPSPVTRAPVSMRAWYRGSAVATRRRRERTVQPASTRSTPITLAVGGRVTIRSEGRGRGNRSGPGAGGVNRSGGGSKGMHKVAGGWEGHYWDIVRSRFRVDGWRVRFPARRKSALASQADQGG